MINNRRYVIVDVQKLDEINFTEVLETSKETCRLSVDGTKSFVKYDVTNRPTFYTEDTQEYTQEEFLQILSTPFWTEEIQE